MAKNINIARVSTSTIGTGSTILLDGSVPGFLSFANAGAVDGDTLFLAIEDGANREVGTYTYHTGPERLTTRAVTQSTNGNSPISLSGTAQVFSTPLAESFTGGTAAAGSDTQVQFNSSGALAASSNFCWINGTDSYLRIGGGGGAQTHPTQILLNDRPFGGQNNRPMLVFNATNCALAYGFGEGPVVAVTSGNQFWFGQVNGAGNAWDTNVAHPANFEIFNGWLGLGYGGTVDATIQRISTGDLAITCASSQSIIFYENGYENARIQGGSGSFYLGQNVSGVNPSQIAIRNTIVVGQPNKPHILFNANNVETWYGMGPGPVTSTNTGDQFWFGQANGPGAAWDTNTAHPAHWEIFNGHLGLGYGGTVDAWLLRESGGALTFSVNNAESMRIDPTRARVFINSTTDVILDTTPSQLQIAADTVTGGGRWGATFIGYGNNQFTGGFGFAKTRNSAYNGHTILNNNDRMVELDGYGSDGTKFIWAGAIRLDVDAAPALNSMPARLVFFTNRGSTSASEALRIDSGGYSTFGGNGANVQVAGANAYVQTVLAANLNAWHFSSVVYGNFTGDVGYSFAKTRGASPTTHVVLNNNDPIVEFDIYGSDGVAYRTAAQIAAAADAAFSSGSSPGRVTISTTPSGSTTLAEHLRIDSAGLFTVGFSGGAGSSVRQILFNDYKNTGNGRPDIIINWGASGYAGIGPATNLADNILRIGRVNGPGLDFAGALSVFILASDNFGIIRSGNLTPDTYLSSSAAASWQLGLADIAAPIAQTLQVQSVIAGTTNTAGVDWTLVGSKGTGTGAGGNIIIKTAPAGTTGTAQNAATERLRIDSAGAHTITSAAAGALTVGANGSTNPVLKVDASTASVATGISIKGAAAAAGLALAVLSSGTNENLTIDAKGSGTITLGSVSTGNIVVSRTLASINQTITSANANALAVGPNGTTNPSFNIDASTASAATGLNIKPAAAAAGLAVSVLSSGSNENLTIDAKGTGTITLGGTSTGNISVNRTLASINHTITSANANALAVGPNGTTNPSFNVDGSTASAATGINIKSAAAAAGVAVSVLSSGTNENLTLDAKGSGTITLNGTATGNITTPRGVFSTGTAGIGYNTGAGGTVTQITSRTTGVTLSKICGAITLFAAAPVVGTWVTFTVTNTLVAATDTIVVSVKSGTNTYIALVNAVAAGSFGITFQSVAGTSSDSPVINFAVIKAVTA